MISDKLNQWQRKAAKDFHPYNRIELSSAALLHNFDTFQRLHPKGSIIPVVKSNAYGHGLEQIAEMLDGRNFPYLAVDGYFEALQVRAVTKRPVLVMGMINPSNFRHMKYEDFAFVVQDIETIKALGKVHKPINVHLEIDTGMHRQGIPLEELDEYLTLIGSIRSLNLEGMMTHLADGDGRTDRYTLRQVDLFDKAIERAHALGFSPRFIHMANSPGAVSADSRYANAARIGLGLYGINPFGERDPRHGVLSDLKPVLALKSTIGRVNRLVKGDRVSYNGIFVSPKDMRIGVLPLGYYEGVRRSLSNRGVVKWDRVFLPIVGRVCMNHTLVDLSGVPAGKGDEVTVISNDSNDKNSVANICEEFDLFVYEFMTNITSTIRRTVVD